MLRSASIVNHACEPSGFLHSNCVLSLSTRLWLPSAPAESPTDNVLTAKVWSAGRPVSDRLYVAAIYGAGCNVAMSARLPIVSAMVAPVTDTSEPDVTGCVSTTKPGAELPRNMPPS